MLYSEQIFKNNKKQLNYMKEWNLQRHINKKLRSY